MNKLVATIIGITITLTLKGSNGEGVLAFVNKVEDGDTIRITITNSTETIRCRLAGIDAPERGQSFFGVANARLAELIEKKNVLFVDLGNEKYKRRLGRIYLENGHDVNLEMVREGFAWHLSYFLTNSVYEATQKEAREARRGLWIEQNPTEPRTYRTPRGKKAIR